MTAVIDLGLKWAHALTQRVVTDAVVLHHAAADGSVEAVHSAHLARGWAGIAYHYYVRKDGSVYRGRPEWAVGGHTSGENWHTLGVCFEGNFEREEMGEAQLEAGRGLIADILGRWGGLAVVPHSYYSQTACPGKNFPLDEMLRKEEVPVVYAKLEDVPEWYRPTIEKLIERGALKGVGGGEIQVDETYCRVMTTLDRLGMIG